jgi:hypothetical protein
MITEAAWAFQNYPTVAVLFTLGCLSLGVLVGVGLEHVFLKGKEWEDRLGGAGLLVLIYYVFPELVRWAQTNTGG